MALTNKYQRITLDQIEVDRESRQRHTLDTSDLEPSIAKRGVIQPIIVERISDRKYKLIAGERRFTASSRLGLVDIPVRFATDLSTIERQIIELEENVKREDLDWKDHVQAIKKIHDLYTLENAEQTQDETADQIGMSRGNVSIAIRVAEELIAGNKNVEAAGGFRAAYNIISRHDERRIGDVMNDLLSEPTGPEKKAIVGTAVLSSGAASGKAALPTILPLSKQDSILNTDFVKWIEAYGGRPFSFIHCDFPYGINLDKSDQANSEQWGGYKDSADTYWKLCETLVRNLDKLMTQQGHLMFWLSADLGGHTGAIETLKFFRSRAASLEFRTVPLIWHKTDNKGILPDPKRGPRQVYETALFASRGDRLTVRSVSNAYGAPTSKEVHQSEKPEPMLRHFFQMFVDEHTRMFDPTCGSGTSLRAAESLGATEVLGLEINSTFCEGARTFLKKFRNLRALENKDGTSKVN